MSQNCKPTGIPLFGYSADHSFVPAKSCAAVARSVGQGRPSGRRASALPLTDASTAARLPAIGRTMPFVALIACLMLVAAVPALAQHAVAFKTPVSDDRTGSIEDFVAEASRRFDVPESWIRAVMRAESAGNPAATSRAGAMGLMQIMPQTWDGLRARYDLGEDPYDPRDNVMAGAAYLRELFDRFGSPGFLAAYNAGPGRYENHLTTGRALPAETRAYLAKLAPVVGEMQSDGVLAAAADDPDWTSAPLFIARDTGVPVDRGIVDGASGETSSEHRVSATIVADLSTRQASSDGLFVRRSAAMSSP